MTKEELIAGAKERYEEIIEDITREEKLKFNLLVHMIELLGKEVTIVNHQQISIATTREDTMETIDKFKNILMPVKIKNSKYTTYSDRSKDESYEEIFPIVAKTDEYGTKLYYSIVSDFKNITVIHKITDAVSRVQVDTECDKYACGEVVYSNCRLITAVDSNIQKYGTHATGLHQYTMWWSYNDKYGKDFREVLDNTFKNSLMVI